MWSSQLKPPGFVAAACMLLAACGADEGQPAGDPTWDWQLPDHFAAPLDPDDNRMSEAKFQLGRRLFYDTRLSYNQTQSCASCHLQSLAFTDGLAQSVGSTGEFHPRSSMSLANAVYNARLTWANPLLDRLEVQALLPIFGEEPVELGFAGREDELVARLAADVAYVDAFALAFPDEPTPINVPNLARGLAAFQRGLISADAPWDRYLAGDTAALTPSQLRGASLFFGERLECFHCHGGFTFSDSAAHDNSMEVAFHNTGLYNLDESGAYPWENRGIAEITGRAEDMGRFRAPTLRNIAVTAPYMHDGSIASLDEVLDHYARGGRQVLEGPNAGDGAQNPLKSEFLQGFAITPSERADLLAFLDALTDETFLTNRRFADPFEESP